MSNNNDGNKKGIWAWLRSISFKELIGAVLSGVLIGLLCFVTARTFGMMDVLPQTVTVGETVQLVDTYARSKELLSTLFPLFAAVVTFWLGVAIEGKRADQNRDAAEMAVAESKTIKAQSAAQVDAARSDVREIQEALSALQATTKTTPDLQKAQDLANKTVKELERFGKTIGI